MISKIIDQNLIEKAQELIEDYENFVIVAHISPDGDACGSSLGLCSYLKALGKDVTVAFNDSISENMEWLPGADQILVYERDEKQIRAKFEQADVIFCLDFNAIKRCGELSQLVLGSSAKKIMIDHHLYPGDFCDVVISYPKISSTSELVFRCICRMGDYELIDKNCAAAIYTGMMTDTGAFTYNSNNPEIYIIISQLLKKGIDKDLIYDKVNNTFSEHRERLMGYTISEKMRLLRQYQCSVISLSSQELERYEYKKGDTEGFVNIPLSVKGIICSVFFREDSKAGYIKVSLRSKGNFPVNILAERHFNGGGHKNASGGEFFGTIDDAINVLEAALPSFTEYLEK